MYFALVLSAREQRHHTIVLNVYNDDTTRRYIPVPLFPDTLGQDVLECVQGSGHMLAHLAAVWNGQDYLVLPTDNIQDTLQEFAGSPASVQFVVRYEDNKRESSVYYNYRRGQRRPGGRSLARENSNRLNFQLPGGGADLTVSELQGLAARQQIAMETQQQALVARETRLKYLQQQEARHRQLAAEQARLRRMRERVEAQELKLKKLRAMRGQVDQFKATNGNLGSELEIVRALFNEKEKELAVAVSKVDQLMCQLQELRDTKNKGLVSNDNKAKTDANAVTLELEKLRNELMHRNQLNEQHNSNLSTKRQILQQRKDEVAIMDARIHELQKRLRKHQSQQQVKNLDIKSTGNNLDPREVPMRPPTKNIAAVEPYIQHAPKELPKDDPFLKNVFLKQDPKYQTHPTNSKFIPSTDDELSQANISEQEVNNNNKANIGNDGNSKPVQYTLPSLISSHFDAHKGRNISQVRKSTIDSQSFPYKSGAPVSNENSVSRPPGSNLVPTTQGKSVQGTKPLPGTNTSQIPSSSLANIASRPFVSAYKKPGLGIWPPSSLKDSEQQQNEQQPQINIFEEERQAGSGQSSPASSEGSGPQTPLVQSSLGPFTDSPTVNAVSTNRALEGASQSDKMGQSFLVKDSNYSIRQGPKPPPRMPQNQNLSSAKPIPSTDHSANSFMTLDSVGQDMRTSDEVDSARLMADSLSPGPPVAISTPLAQGGDTGKSMDSVNVSSGSTTIHLNQRPTPTYRYAPKSVIANTYMGRLGNAALERYQKNLNRIYKNQDFRDHPTISEQSPQTTSNQQPPFDTPSEGRTSFSREVSSLSDANLSADVASKGLTHFESVGSHNYPDVASDKGSFKSNTPKHIRRRHSDSDNEDLNKFLQRTEKQQTVSRLENFSEDSNNNLADSNNSESSRINVQLDPVSPKETALSRLERTSCAEDKTIRAGPPSPFKAQQTALSGAEGAIKRKKTNLKDGNAVKSNNRVCFDPLALLLDASLEGEVDLVMKTAQEVSDVSAPNDEGITALHNAICAGHYDIVKFLVEFGCDVNSPDSDGWMPLHCAASCNNLPMVRFLVEHGACIFATTVSDNETAAEKCEEDEDGYDGCSDYLYSVQEKLGILNNGEVYAVFDYDAQNSDELSFRIGDKMLVLRKGDETEKEWWWAQKAGKEGYIPRNLLGLYPRVMPSNRQSQ